MREPLSVNNHPLNQRAKKLLKEAGQYPDPYLLYAAQLIRWGLDSGQVLAAEDPELLDQGADQLLAANPRRGLAFLMDNPEGGSPDETMVHWTELNGLSPMEGAVLLAEALNQALRVQESLSEAPN